MAVNDCLRNCHTELAYAILYLKANSAEVFTRLNYCLSSLFSIIVWYEFVSFNFWLGRSV